jgi:hypothetical protein
MESLIVLANETEDIVAICPKQTEIECQKTAFVLLRIQIFVLKLLVYPPRLVRADLGKRVCWKAEGEYQYRDLHVKPPPEATT